MPPNPVVAPQERSQADATAAASAASTVARTATGVFCIRRAARISSRAIPVKISSGATRAGSKLFTAHLQQVTAPPESEDRREDIPDRDQETRRVTPTAPVSPL